MSLKLNNLSITFLGETEAVVKDFNLESNVGEIVLILGETGAGKSTLLQTFNGIVPKYKAAVQDGEIFVDGLNTRDHETYELATHLGIVFQDPETQIISITVGDDCAFGPGNLGLTIDQVEARVAEALKVVNLVGFNDRNPHSLSGGEKQRLSIAGIYAMKPKIIAFDEPICMLDSKGKSEIEAVLKDLAHNAGMNILITESGSDIERLIRYATRVVYMRKGEKILDGDPHQIYSNVKIVEQERLPTPQITDVALKLGEYDQIPLTDEEGVDYIRKYLDKKGISKIIVPEREIRVPNMNGEPVLHVKDVHFFYPGYRPYEALRDISFDIYKGNIVGLIGQNGSGKSTLALTLVGLNKPSNPEAEISVAGVDVIKSPLNETIQHINYVFQNPKNQLFSDTPLEEVKYGLTQLGRNVDIDKVVDDTLKLFGLDSIANTPIEYLPWNLKTFTAVSSIIALDPDVIIVDEPTTGLDWDSASKIMEILGKLNREKQKTFIIISHNMELIAEHCDRVILMKKAEISTNTSTREAFSRPDILASASMDPPQVARIAQALKNYGFPPDVLTIDEMYNIIKYNVGK